MHKGYHFICLVFLVSINHEFLLCNQSRCILMDFDREMMYYISFISAIYQAFMCMMRSNENPREESCDSFNLEVMIRYVGYIADTEKVLFLFWRADIIGNTRGWKKRRKTEEVVVYCMCFKWHNTSAFLSYFSCVSIERFTSNVFKCPKI